MPFEELPNDGVGIEPDRRRVVADERFSENAGRPSRHVVALQPLEQDNIDTGDLGDRSERDLSPFALVAQPCAKTVRGHASKLQGHRRTMPLHALPAQLSQLTDLPCL